jgi:hypothetical protein
MQFILRLKFQYSFLITILTLLLQSHCKLEFVSPLQLDEVRGDYFGTRPKKMRISQRLFIRF